MLVFAALFFQLQVPSAHAALYTFTSHTFTSCGATGQSGPTTANCTSAYSAATWTANSSYFTTTSGIQKWTVPSTASYRITAYGARGGNASSGATLGGAGAKAMGDFTLTQGDVISILVGQTGGDNTASSGSAGGGGGTFIVTSSNSALIVAGGGGGAAFSGSTGTSTGVDGNNINAGTAGRDGVIAGGTGGAGGATPSGAWSGSSGGGFNSAGGNGTNSSTGGASFLSGGGGGNRGNSYGSVGGFGGGGGATWGAAGGGGYSGGGADYSDGNWIQQGGGGGGSYVSGTNTSMLAGQNSGAGYVTIQILVGAPDAPTIGTATVLSPTTATVTFTAPANNNGDTITAYTATSSPGSITGSISQSGSGTITISGLSPNTSYTFTVTATNNYGTSSASGSSNSITTNKQSTTITIALTGNAITASYRTQTTITATIVGTDGKVTFFLNSKRIGGCINRPTSSLVATCLWKPSLHGNATISASFTPTSLAYLSSNTSKLFPILARSNNR